MKRLVAGVLVLLLVLGIVPVRVEADDEDDYGTAIQGFRTDLGLKEAKEKCGLSVKDDSDGFMLVTKDILAVVPIYAVDANVSNEDACFVSIVTLVEEGVTKWYPIVYLSLIHI